MRLRASRESAARALLATALAVALTIAAVDARADAKQECVRAHESAQILRREGKLRASREQLLICRQETCPDILRAACSQWLEELDADMPTIVFEGRDAQGQPDAEIRVAVDGVPVAERLDGRAMPIDPGEHTIRFEAADKKTRELRVIIAEGQKNRLIVADFEVKPPPAAPAPPVPGIAPPPAPSLALDLDALDRIAAARSRRTVGFAIGGIGLASAAVGAVFGGLALGAASDAKCGPPCPASDANGVPNPALASARDHYDRATTFAWVSNVTLATGIVAVVVGSVLVLTGRAPDAAASPSRAIGASAR